MEKIGRIFLAVLLCTVFLSGCNEQKSWNPLKNGGEVKIAVLGDSNSFEVRRDFFEGMNVAVEELAANGVKISYTHFDDENNYDKGVSLAKEIVTNDSYPIAMTFQDFETVDTVASIFEEYNKPLIIADGCYDETMNKGYNYILNLTVTMEDSGNELGLYAIKKKYKWVAVAHTGRDAKSLQNGLNDALSGSNESYIIDLMNGPNKETEITDVFDRWKTLGVQAVVVTMDDRDWLMELVKHIRTYCPEMAILGDRYFNDLSYMGEYGQYLEGIVMPGSFSVKDSKKLDAFYEKYTDKIDYDYLNSPTGQGYDIINMIVERMNETNNSGEFLSNMKSETGYEGIVGIKFKQNGSLDNVTSYWVIKDNIVYRAEHEAVAGMV